MKTEERKGLLVDQIVSRSITPGGIVVMMINGVGFRCDYEQAASLVLYIIDDFPLPDIVIVTYMGETYVLSDDGARFYQNIPDGSAAANSEACSHSPLRSSLRSASSHHSWE